MAYVFLTLVLLINSELEQIRSHRTPGQRRTYHTIEMRGLDTQQQMRRVIVRASHKDKSQSIDYFVAIEARRIATRSNAFSASISAACAPSELPIFSRGVLFTDTVFNTETIAFGATLGQADIDRMLKCSQATISLAGVRVTIDARSLFRLRLLSGSLRH